MTTLQQIVRRSVGIVDDDEFRGEWVGVSGSSYEPNYHIDWYDERAKHKWPQKEVYFRYIECEYCRTRNPNDNKTFYCVACGGPLPA